MSIQNMFDSNDNVISSSVTIGNNTQNYLFEYSKNLSQKLLKTTLSNVYVQDLSYDLLGRIKQVKTTFGVKEYTKQYSYLTKGDKTSNYIAAEWFGFQGINRAAIHYTYDLKGNIIKIKHDGQFVVGYEYDEVNRLVRENNKKLGFTKTYDYDAGGNILEERKYYFTINSLDDESPIEIKKYLYKSEGWRDQLMGYSIKTIDYYNDTSTTIDYEVGEYDSLGNPHKYNGNTMTWTRGRCLSSYNGNTFTYNADSIRTSKTKVVNNTNITTNFVLNGTKILSQSDGTNTLYFQYGSNGVEGFTLNGTQYIYQKNILGDIIGIFDSNQQLVAKYAYDAWGNQKIYALIDNEMIDITGESIYNTNIANINPFRYRGYYFDVETGLYYLNSRYYDPSLGRFINADDIGVIDLTKVAINGLNLFAYCLNNPVNEKDESGYFLSFLLGLLIAAAIGATVGAVSYTASFVIGGITTGNWNWNWAGFLGSVVGGFIGGMFMMIPVVGVYVSAFATGFLSNLMTDAYSSALYSVKIDWRSSLGISVLSGLLSLALSSLITKAFGISGINTGSINWSTITTNSYELLGKGIINKVSDQILYFMIGSTIYGSALDALFHNDFMSIINELRRRIFV